MLISNRFKLSSLLYLILSQALPVTSENDIFLGCIGKQPCADVCTCCYKQDSTDVVCQGPGVKEIPPGIPVNATDLTFKDTGLVYVNYTSMSGRLSQLTQLQYILFNNNELLEEFKPGFSHLPESLTQIYIKGSTKLSTILPGVFGYFTKLQVLEISGCGLTSAPYLSSLQTGMDHSIKVVNLRDNQIKALKSKDFNSLMGDIAQLNLENNQLEHIEKEVFVNSSIGSIILRNNTRLTSVHEEAFRGIKHLATLDLSNTAITSLPIVGLADLDELIMKDTPTLREMPSVLALASLTTASLTYSQHCCAFAHPEVQDEEAWLEFKAKLDRECTTSATTPSSVRDMSQLPPTLPPTAKYRKNEKYKNNTNSLHRHKRDSWSSGDIVTPNMGEWITHTIDPNKIHTMTIKCGLGHINRIKSTKCTPTPDAFNPCEDVMGSTLLRASVWIVSLCALLSNAFVFVVSITAATKITVHKFLMSNLQFSDFLLGCYLLILASIDMHTIDVYFTKAIPWQYGPGCKSAGFLAIFASTLSISTLVVITIERWYAITHAIDLTKRVKLSQACSIMVGCWLFSIVLAMLPLMGVSSYSQTSICLPMRADSVADKIYLSLLLLSNMAAFVVISMCYVDMYRQVKSNKTAAGRNDASVAKKMAVLVFTDFACLFPIALFGLTATAGKPLITVSQSKILLVFFFPINSFCNPILYAALTQNFKKELVGLLSRCGFCKKRAAKYKYTYSSNPVSLSLSRNSISGHLNHLVKSPSTTVYQRCATNNGSNATTRTTPTPTQTPYGSRKGSPLHTPPTLQQSMATIEAASDLHSEVVRKLSTVKEVSRAPSTASEPDIHKDTHLKCGPLTNRDSQILEDKVFE